MTAKEGKIEKELAKDKARLAMNVANMKASKYFDDVTAEEWCAAVKVILDEMRKEGKSIAGNIPDSAPGHIIPRARASINDATPEEWDEVRDEMDNLIGTVRNMIPVKDMEEAKRIVEETRASMDSISTSDGSTASYYELPPSCTELQDLISYKDMNAQLGEIFRACYRYGKVSHSGKLRDAKKIKFYINAEIARLEKLV